MKKSGLVDQRALWLMLAPVLLYFIVFRYLPMGGILIAFKRYSPFRGFNQSPWVGLQYFIQFVDSIYFQRVLKNTLLIGFYYITLAFPFPILLALLLNNVRNSVLRKTCQTITLFPYFVSFVVIAGIAINMLSPSTGVVNLIRKSLGMEPVFFMQKPEYFKFIYTVIRIFKESGYEAIVYLAALTTIDPSLYEAARCDGANKLQQLRYVTIPGIIPAVVIMFLVRVGRLVTVSFEEVLLLQNSVNLSSSEVISTYVYRRGLVGADYSYATAVGLLETVVALILVVTSNKLARRFKSETALW
ncbi:MAG: sugar ABC transporter permease [Spirochaetales bacterium]